MANDSQIPAEVGTFSATCVIVHLDKAEAQSLLPDELQLGNQKFTPDGTHPLICLFGTQKNVRTVFAFSDHAHPRHVIPALSEATGSPARMTWRDLMNVLGRRLEQVLRFFHLLPSMKYLEVITLLPCVEWADPNSTPQGPFMFAPRLYLSKLLPTLLGWLLGLAKEVARFTADQDSIRANRLLLDDVLLLTASTKPTGEPNPPSKFRNFAPIQSMLGFPNIGQTHAGPFVSVDVYFDWDKAQVQACQAKGKLTSDFFSPALREINFPEKSIDEEVLGAFFLKVPWRLTAPIICKPASEVLL